ncbi:MAG: argininosuccinate lyase [Alphaproteobacteria bacterium]|nr:argininosuccinate lyase [Alphaproteobacteria bacterium]
MWGGRYAEGPAAIMRDMNASIGVDQRLAADDIQASRAHATMLASQKIISAEDARKIDDGLAQIDAEIKSGKFPMSVALEDIHMNIEARLTERVGEAGRRLHTARSRNDQVATDFKLWVRRACDDAMAAIVDLQKTLLQQAALHTETIMPSFTHWQPAQPVSFAFHLLAYVDMLGRDVSRFCDARRRMNECPLGSGAVAGTSFPIDRAQVAQQLGFDRPTANAMDSVSDRDFAIDYVAAAATLMLHLSRLAEEIILWSTPAFGFIQLPEALTTGSSMMPQKRNPDAAELVRGKTSRVTGNLMSLVMLMKALPLAYNKDLQEDKPPVFDTYDQLALSLSAMTAMVGAWTVNAPRMADMAEAGYTTATELADWLVQELAIPFRDAHHMTGQVVRLAEEKNVRLSQLSLEDLQRIVPRIHAGVFHVLSANAAMQRRRSFGGTAPDVVRQAIAEAHKRLS